MPTSLHNNKKKLVEINEDKGDSADNNGTGEPSTSSSSSAMSNATMPLEAPRARPQTESLQGALYFKMGKDTGNRSRQWKKRLVILDLGGRGRDKPSMEQQNSCRMSVYKLDGAAESFANTTSTVRNIDRLSLSRLEPEFVISALMSSPASPLELDYVVKDVENDDNAFLVEIHASGSRTRRSRQDKQQHQNFFSQFLRLLLLATKYPD